MQFVFSYLTLINVLGLAFMLADKRRARKNRWRIPEARLMAIALAGGSLGILAGMHLFRHKTKHPKFSIGVPVIFAAQVVLAVFALPYFLT